MLLYMIKEDREGCLLLELGSPSYFSGGNKNLQPCCLATLTKAPNTPRPTQAELPITKLLAEEGENKHWLDHRLYIICYNYSVQISKYPENVKTKNHRQDQY